VKFKESTNRLRVVAPENPTSSRFAEAVKALLQWNRRPPELLESPKA
jgi:hypothetical protein